MCDEATDKLTAEQTARLSAGMSAGDEAAVDLFYRRYFDWLYAQARAATRRDESFCLDIVQDAVLRIIRTVRRVESEVQLRAWMRLVVQTTAFDHLRSERRRVHREALVLIQAAGGAAEPDADDPADESQRQWLREQLARFDPQLIRIIELRYEQRWTLTRIAALLGLSIGTVDGRLRRAIRDLRLRASESFDDT